MQFKSKDISLQGFDKLSHKEKIIFLAGVFDGEGSFGCYTTGLKKRGRYLLVAVETTDADMVSRFAEVFGGMLYSLKKREEHHKYIFRWRINGKKAWKVLDEMVPYMCLRRRQKYATLEPYRNSTKNSRRAIQKQKSDRNSNVGSSIDARRENEAWRNRI